MPPSDCSKSTRVLCAKSAAPEIRSAYLLQSCSKYASSSPKPVRMVRLTSPVRRGSPHRWSARPPMNRIPSRASGRKTGRHSPAETGRAFRIRAKIACCATSPEVVLTGPASVAANAAFNDSMWSATSMLRSLSRRSFSSWAPAIRHRSTNARSSRSRSPPMAVEYTSFLMGPNWRAPCTRVGPGAGLRDQTSRASLATACSGCSGWAAWRPQSSRSASPSWG